MAAYLLRRILWLGPVLLFISLVTFALMHLIEGGPWDEERPLPPEVIEQLNRQYGLDKPLWRQYLMFATNALQGDLGRSYRYQGKPVTPIIVSGIKVSGVLGVLALSLAVTAGVGLGVTAALHRNRPVDYAGVAFASMGSAVPGFVLGIVLIYLFGVKVHWFASFGWDVKHGILPGWLPPLRQLVLPLVTLAALPAAYLARVTRASLLDVLSQDYMRTARAKGLRGSTVLRRHAMRNAVIPIVTIVGPMTVALVTGSFIVEQIFSIPGTGRMFVLSVNARDYGLIMGTTLFYATVIVLANLMVDIAYAFCDPRIRYQ